MSHTAAGVVAWWRQPGSHPPAARGGDVRQVRPRALPTLVSRISAGDPRLRPRASRYRRQLAAHASRAMATEHGPACASPQSSQRSPARPLALDEVDGETAACGLLVLDLHIRAGLPHGLDGLVERHVVLAVAAYGHPGRGDRLDRADRVAL